MQLTSHGCIEEGSPAVTTTMKVDISSMSHQQPCHLTEEGERKERREKSDAHYPISVMPYYSQVPSSAGKV